MDQIGENCGRRKMEEGPSVFVVDDDLRVQKALSNLISSAGFRVVTFGSASAFLGSERPD